MAAGRAQRAGRRPPGRVGGGGGAGAGAFAASPPRSAAASELRLRSPALSTPFSSFLFLPRAPVWPRCRLGRANLQHAAKTQEEALTAAAAASNMADAVGPRTWSRRRRPARPLATGPRVARGRAGPSRRAARARAAGIAEAGEGRRSPAPGASAVARTGGEAPGGFLVGSVSPSVPGARSKRATQKLAWDACMQQPCGNAGLSDRNLSISEAGRNPERPVWTRKRNP